VVNLGIIAKRKKLLGGPKLAGAQYKSFLPIDFLGWEICFFTGFQNTKK
jgi:hypothetical protein